MKAIIVFVKAPRPGRVKTRLAVSLGADKAAALYRSMALATVETARAVLGARVFVAYDGDHPEWLVGPEISWFRQEGRHLGERLKHAF